VFSQIFYEGKHMKLTSNDIAQLKEFRSWLDDNVEQETDIIFGSLADNNVTSESLLPIVDAIFRQIDDTHIFVIVGRVSDEDNIMMFINAIDSDQAKDRFIEHVKVEQDWDGERDIYIEFCINLSNHQKNHVYTDAETADSSC
jgi:hypothetical protein